MAKRKTRRRRKRRKRGGRDGLNDRLKVFLNALNLNVNKQKNLRQKILLNVDIGAHDIKIRHLQNLTIYQLLEIMDGLTQDEKKKFKTEYLKYFPNHPLHAAVPQFEDNDPMNINGGRRRRSRRKRRKS